MYVDCSCPQLQHSPQGDKSGYYLIVMKEIKEPVAQAVQACLKFLDGGRVYYYVV